MNEVDPTRQSLILTLRRVAPIALIVAIAALMLVEARHVNLRQIQESLASVAPLWLALLGVAGIIAVMAMSGYDLLAARVLGLSRTASKGLRTGLMANGINNVAGLSGMTGPGLRVLLLAREGIDTAQAVRYAGLAASAGPLGLSVLAWITLVANPLLLDATAVPGWLVRTALGVLALYLPIYIVIAITPASRRGRLAPLLLLRPLAAVGFVAISTIEWLLAGAVLWGCLAAVGLPLSPLTVIGAFALAATLGMASFLPGGFGVFDVTLVALLVARGAPADAAVAGLVLFRYAYYLVPLLVALYLGSVVLRSSHLAAALRTHPMFNLLQWPVARAAELGIRVLSWLTALAGIVLLAGAAFPNLISHTELLRDWEPLPAVEATHLASVAVGLTLIAAARGLSLRLNRALWLAVGLLLVGAVFGLARGLDWGTSVLLLAVACVLFVSRGSFDRKGNLGRQLGAWQWTVTLVIALLAYLLIGQTFYHPEKLAPLHFAFGAHNPRFIRGAFVAIISVIVLLIWTWPRWPRPSFTRPTEAELERLIGWLETHGSNGYSHLMLLGDKTLFFDSSDHAMIGFSAIHNRLVALSDPVGEPEARKRAIGEFRRFAESLHCTPVFYQVGPDDLPLYLDHGFSLFKLGEIARVNLLNFSMKGSVNENKRGALNRGNRLGMAFDMAQPPFAGALMAELRSVSDDWMGEKPAEKAFSLGRFDTAYLSRAPIALVRDEQGGLLAFASILPSYGHKHEYSIDLMRHRSDAPGGSMDFLFVRLMQEAQAQGYEWFSLGMAPLAGVGDTPWANTAEQLARLAFEHGNHFYNYKGLKAFKDKWHPSWHSMYLAYPPNVHLSTVQVDIAALIAGGYRRIVGSG